MKLFLHLPGGVCNVYCKSLLGVLFSLFFSFQMYAQSTVSGAITDAESGESLLGVSVMAKGTSKGTVTDLNGNYSIELAQGENVLVFSFVGYDTKEVTVNGATTLDVTLDLGSIGLNEVTVTALGISRQTKSLGYAVQEVDGDNLNKAKDANFINNLAGKVAGVTIVGNPSGIGASSRVTIRGERSLNINANQPLFVIDGVPIINEVLGSSGRSYQEADYGNGAGFVNPDDVESVTVLKGAGATALYGSRGANGVILITTKRGKSNKGIGVSVNSTLMFENTLILPDYQNVYGQGLGGQFDFKDGNGGGLADGVDENWGPAFDGQPRKQFDGRTSNGLRGGDVGNLSTQIGPVNLAAQLAARGEITPTPWVARPDNVKDFFETGVLQSHNLAIGGSNESGDFRVSYTWLDQTGVVPNTDLERSSLAFSGGYKIGDKLSIRAVVNYVDSYSGNRPNLSYGTENIMYLFNCWLGRGVDLRAMRDYWQAGREGLNQFNFNYNYHDNPYFGLYENTNSQDLDRVYGYASATYKFTDWLSLTLRGATDVIDELRTRKRAYSTQRFQRGSYREEQIRLQETNLDALLTANRDLNSDLSLGVSIGGNLRRNTYNNIDVSAGELAVPEIYSLNNSRIPLTSNTFRFEKQINSAYATAQLGFRRFLYLDLTGRNDWSSTLPEEDWSYFYYSASASAVLSELLGSTPGSALSFLKVRASIAQVGNDTDPFQLSNVYNSAGAVKGSPSYTETGRLANSELKPEISTSIEAGVDVRFFNDRLGLDLSVYRSRSENQILFQQISNASGFNQRAINAGLIENSGVEAALNIVPVRLNNSLEWNLFFNFSANRSEVKELFKDPQTGREITEYVLADRYIQVQARVGEQMGDMYGIGYARVSDNPNDKYYDKTGQNVGQIVYNTAGKPVPTDLRIKLGNYNPDFLLGLGTGLSFKGLNLNVLFDIRSGGEIYSHTQTVGREGGIIEETLEGRADGYDLTKPGNGVIGAGVIQNGDGSFRPNDVKLSSREWHTSITLGRRLLESMIYDASFVKLREVRLGYTLPNRLIGKFPIKDISLSLVGRNLALWSDVPHIDPETASTVGGTIIPGVESVALPSTRSYGLNLNFKF